MMILRLPAFFLCVLCSACAGTNLDAEVRSQDPASLKSASERDVVAQTCQVDDWAQGPLGSTVVEFAEDGRPLRVIEEGEAGFYTTVFDYDAEGRPLSAVKNRDGSNASPDVVTYETVVSEGSTTVIATGPSNTRPQRVVYHYDADGQRTETETDSGNDGGVDWVERCVYDELGRPIRILRESGGSTLVTEWSYTQQSAIPTGLSQSRDGVPLRVRVGTVQMRGVELIVERLFNEGVSDEVHSSRSYRPFCAALAMKECVRPWAPPAP